MEITLISSSLPLSGTTDTELLHPLVLGEAMALILSNEIRAEVANVSLPFPSTTSFGSCVPKGAAISW